MSTNYVPLEQAAKMLGMSVEQLNDLRLKNEVFGTRDGNEWKFKLDEIKRYADEAGIQLGDSSIVDSGDLQFSDSGELIHADDSRDVLEDDELPLGSSDIARAAESSGNVLSGNEPSGGSPSDTGKMIDGGESPVDEEELFDDDLLLQESVSFEGSSDLGSDIESNELLLDDSDSDEVELDSADTGISLGPTDSGIALDEEPLELGGSDIDSLELPEDDEIISLEDAVDSDSLSAELGSADDDFNLTPLEDSLDDDFSSGSQVIALEDSAVYTDDSAPTMLSEDDLSQGSAAQHAYQGGPYPGDAGPIVYAPPEAPYSIWNVLSLAAAFAIVTLLTIVTIDLARNMWQPSGVTLSNSVVNFFLRLFGWDVQS